MNGAKPRPQTQGKEQWQSEDASCQTITKIKNNQVFADLLWKINEMKQQNQQANQPPCEHDASSSRAEPSQQRNPRAETEPIEKPAFMHDISHKILNEILNSNTKRQPLFNLSQKSLSYQNDALRVIDQNHNNANNLSNRLSQEEAQMKQ